MAKGALINEIGNRYGNLVVIDRVETRKTPKGNRSANWLCKCDCGRTHIAKGIHLRSGSVKSCGCLNKYPTGQAALHAVFCRMKNSAIRRGYIFELDEIDFIKLSQKPCNYCGSEPVALAYMPDCNGSILYNGIDRVDNTKGYIEGNMVTCCWICNRAKGTMPLLEFEKWIKDITEYMKIKRYNHELQQNKDLDTRRDTDRSKLELGV